MVPLAGARPRKLTRVQREEILSALGRNVRFTEVVFEMFEVIHAGCLAEYKDWSLEEIVDGIVEDEDDPPHAVSSLIVLGRYEVARELAAWAESEVAENPVLDLLGTLIEEERETKQSLTATQRKLASQRKAHKRLERKAEKAKVSMELRAAEARQARALAEEAEAAVARERSAREEMVDRITSLEAQVEAQRREKRDLVSELEQLQVRFVRVRRELREARAQIPPEPESVRKIRRTEPPPTAGEIYARLRAGGPAEVLNTRRLLVIVDGWNVGLGHIAKERLQEKRRILEQALERYHGRTGNKVMIVYDGAKIDWFRARTTGRPTVMRVFTPEGVTADDYIVGELEADHSDYGLVVITSDRELQERCVSRGSFVLSSEKFAEALSI